MSDIEKLEFAEQMIELFKQAAPAEALGGLANRLMSEKLA
jgi:hypothetical protein